MVIDGFDEILNTLYIAKRLYDMGRYEVAEANFFDTVDYDVYYENMYGLIENIFENCYGQYYEKHGMEIHVLSDPVIVDFCVLAGEYGKAHKIPDEQNPYIQEARQEIGRHLNFSYCLDWRFMVHTEPKRPFHSRIGIFIYQDDYVDLGWLAYGLVEIYEWFSDACMQLRDILQKKKADVVKLPGEEVMAA